MWYITTRGFTLQEILIMAAMNVASDVKKKLPARAKAAKAASAAGNASELVWQSPTRQPDAVPMSFELTACF